MDGFAPLRIRGRTYILITEYMQLSDTASTLRVLADETRLRILHLLWYAQPRRWAVGELVEVLALPQPTVSRHLSVLREESLVARHREGTFRYYELADPQRRVHAALLAALEDAVRASPMAREDAARADALDRRDEDDLTADRINATEWLPKDDDAMDHLFKALGHPIRRRILDAVGRAPGCTLSELADGFDQSRVSVTKHVATLERAGLIHSRRQGRERRLYADPMPVQLVYDRWTDRFSAPLAARVADLKYRAEEEATR